MNTGVILAMPRDGEATVDGASSRADHTLYQAQLSGRGGRVAAERP